MDAELATLRLAELQRRTTAGYRGLARLIVREAEMSPAAAPALGVVAARLQACARLDRLFETVSSGATTCAGGFIEAVATQIEATTLEPVGARLEVFVERGLRDGRVCAGLGLIFSALAAGAAEAFRTQRRGVLSVSLLLPGTGAVILLSVSDATRRTSIPRDHWGLSLVAQVADAFSGECALAQTKDGEAVTVRLSCPIQLEDYRCALSD